MNNHSTKQFDNYRIKDIIGCGSFGEVYKAEHMVLPNRVVAIKLLKTSLASQKMRDRFLAETRILAQLRHSHLVPLYEASIDGEVPYLVSEYVPEGSLKRRLDQLYGRSFTVEEVLRILQQIGQALHYIHKQGIIHGDLKPANILFNKRSEAVLADVGVAIILDEAHRSSSPSPSTPTYTAPEQFQGRVSEASDQYALGCIAYELLTGMKPFFYPPEIVESLYTRKDIEGTQVPPSRWNPEISPDAERVVLKAMAKREADRYVDVVAFVETLQSALEQGSSWKGSAPELDELLKEIDGLHQTGLRSSSQDPDKALPENGDPLALVRHCITRPFVEKALDQLSWLERACLLLHVNAGFLPQEIAGIVNASEQQVCEALELGRERVLQSYYFYLEQEQILPVGRYSGSTAPDNTHRIAALLESIPITGYERPDQTIPLKKQSVPAEIASELDIEPILAQYDPYIVALVQSMSRHGSLAVPREVLELEIESIVQQVRIKFWQILQKRHIEHPKTYIWEIVQNEYRDLSRRLKPPLPLRRDEDSELSGGDVTMTASESATDLANVWGLAFSPDGTRIASGEGTGAIQIWDVVDGGHVLTYSGHTNQIFDLKWSPNGQFIASASADGTVHVWNASDGKTVYIHRFSSAPVQAIFWSPDGTRIASASADGTVQLWDALDGVHPFIYSHHSGEVCNVVWSPDGSRIALGDENGTVQVWHAM